MDANSVVREIRRKKPRPSRYRAPKGAWVKPAWAVRRLVEDDRWMVSDAVREVVARLNLCPADAAFAGVRAAYYVVKDKKREEEPK